MDSFDSLFEEFKTISRAEWEAKLSKDLKGKKAEELNWQDEDGIEHLAYYDSSNSILQNPKGVKGWQISQTYLVEEWDSKELINELEAAFANGLQKSILMGNQKMLTAIQDSVSSLKQADQIDFLLQDDLQNYPDGLGKEFLIDPLGYAIYHEKLSDDFKEELKTFFSTYSSSQQQSGILVDASIYGEMGATASQEISLAMRHITEYLDLMTDAGISAETAFAKLQIRLSIGSSYFSQMAKFKALRANLEKMLAYYEANEIEIFIWASSNPYYLDPKGFNNNLIRLSCQAMSAVMGNADAISLTPIGMPKDKKTFAYRMCRNIQLMLKHESHFDKVADLSAGAYYIDQLKSELMGKSWDAFVKAEAKGSFMKEWMGGEPREAIEKAAKKRELEYSQQAQVMVGVNKYRFEELEVDQAMPEQYNFLAAKLNEGGK